MVADIAANFTRLDGGSPQGIDGLQTYVRNNSLFPARVYDEDVFLTGFPPPIISVYLQWAFAPHS